MDILFVSMETGCGAGNAPCKTDLILLRDKSKSLHKIKSSLFALSGLSNV